MGRWVNFNNWRVAKEEKNVKKVNRWRKTRIQTPLMIEGSTVHQSNGAGGTIIMERPAPL